MGESICRNLLRAALDHSAGRVTQNRPGVTPNDIREFARPAYPARRQAWEDMHRPSRAALMGRGHARYRIDRRRKIHDTEMLTPISRRLPSPRVLASSYMAFSGSTRVIADVRLNRLATQAAASPIQRWCWRNPITSRACWRRDRVMTVPRSLVAYERGAVAPAKRMRLRRPLSRLLRLSIALEREALRHAPGCLRRQCDCRLCATNRCRKCACRRYGTDGLGRQLI